jgi:hypothetical protein
MACVPGCKFGSHTHRLESTAKKQKQKQNKRKKKMIVISIIIRDLYGFTFYIFLQLIHNRFIIE